MEILQPGLGRLPRFVQAVHERSWTRANGFLEPPDLEGAHRRHDQKLAGQQLPRNPQGPVATRPVADSAFTTQGRFIHLSLAHHQPHLE